MTGTSSGEGAKGFDPGRVTLTFATNVQETKAEEFRQFRAKVLKDSTPVVGYETVRQRKDGSLIDVALTTAPRRNADGEVVGVVGLYEDITERKQREAELERYERIVETATDPIYTLDSELRVSSANGAMADLVGRNATKLIGEHVTTVSDPLHTDALIDAVTMLRTGETTQTTIETGIVDASGTGQRFQTTIAVKASESGVQRGRLCEP